MIKQIKQTIEKYRMFDDVHTVIAAVSGGADSVCMLDVLRKLAKIYDFQLVCAHLNHNLRGKESDFDANFVQKLCKNWGISLKMGSEKVEKIAKKCGLGIEEAARKARYEFLRGVASEYPSSVIATAHTANDNAETVLFHLVRGTGVRGMAGISPKANGVIRPLIGQTRAEVEAYCKENGLEFVFDSTNDDIAYARNRIRREVIPQLMQINSAVVENINAFAEIAKEWDAEQTAAAQALYPTLKKEQGFDLAYLLTQSDMMQTALLRIFLEEQGIEPKRNLLLRLQSEIKSEKTVSRIPVDAEHYVAICYGYLQIVCADMVPDAMPFDEKGTVFGRYCISAEQGEYSRRYSLSADALNGAVLRSAKEKDVYVIPGVGSKSVRRLYIEKKIPRHLREAWPLIAVGDEVVWIYKIGVSAPFCVKGNEPFINIIVEELQE